PVSDGWPFARYSWLVPAGSQRGAGSVLTPGAGPAVGNWPIAVTAGQRLRIRHLPPAVRRVQPGRPVGPLGRGWTVPCVRRRGGQAGLHPALLAAVVAEPLHA